MCSRDPECLEGHKGMVFHSGSWRNPEKRHASQRRYDTKRRALGTMWEQTNPDLRRETKADYTAFHRLQGTM